MALVIISATMKFLSCTLSINQNFARQSSLDNWEIQFWSEGEIEKLRMSPHQIEHRHINKQMGEGVVQFEREWWMKLDVRIGRWDKPTETDDAHAQIWDSLETKHGTRSMVDIHSLTEQEHSQTQQREPSLPVVERIRSFIKWIRETEMYTWNQGS